MLVVTRKVDQSVQIGDDVRITIVRVGWGNVRIGIEAPDSVRVLRTELLERQLSVASGQLPAEVEA